MEENSEVQMETDVSSTTVDMPDTMQVTGIHGNVKTTIVVEEIKEEDINSNISAEPSPTKSNEVQKVLLSSKLPLEKGLPKEIIISSIKEIQVTQKITPPNSKEVNCTPTESDTEQKTPTKTDYMQTTLTKSEQVQKTQPKLIQVLKAPAKFEHVQKIVSKSDQLQNTPNKELVKTAPKSEQLQIKASMTEQVPKKLEQMEEVLRVSETMLQQTSKKDQNSKTLPKLEQVHKTPVEQVNKKLDQFKKYLGLKSISISEQLQKAQTNSEQVKKTSAVLEVHNKSDQVKNTHELNSKSITPSNPSEQQTTKDAIHTTLNYTAVKSSDVPDTIVIDKSLKETKQPEESNEQQELPKESPRKPDPVNKSDHSSKSNKTSIKESIDQQTLNKDCFNSTNQTKESSDKLKGDKNNERKSVVNNTSIDIVEKSNDSQLEASSDIPEKDHNRSISRELKSLIKSAKESKIISECTQLTSKTRKSRAVADSSNTSLNVSVEADKIQNVRRSSINSQESNCSEKSERAPAKRSMRSQNPEFVNKVKLFLNSVTGKNQKGDDEDELDDSKKETFNESSSPLPKKKKLVDSQKQEAAEHTNRLRSDLYCWRCHWVAEQAVNEKGHPPLLCTVCPRSFHYKCLSSTERSKITNEKSWICPECLVVLHAESSETRSLAMKKISLGHLCELLQYALERMMDLNGVEPFILPVDRTAFPDYEKYVVHPMDLSLMKKNISEGLYGSTEAFLADSQWILHNSIIFNTCMMQSKLTAVARALVRSCRAEMGEIEACPECYSAAHARRPTWFTDVCSTPHMLLWAKLKGFPYWPAKGMSVNSQGLVDVRFFGAHDRAWVPARDCFLYCEKDPNNFKAKRQDILESMHEAEDHIRNISRKYGKFVYAAFKTHLDPTKLSEQLKMMIPSFDGEVRSQLKEKSSNASPKTVKDKGRSSSKSSKSSINESDVSENEDAKTILPRKMADGAEIAREQDYFSTDKNSPMEVDEQNVSKKDEQNITKKEKSPSRKRRRSGLEEAVITIITTSSNEKRKRVEDERVKHDKQAESVEESTEKREENLLNSNQSDETAEKFKEDKDKEEFTIPVISKVEDKEVSVVNIDKTQTVPSMSIKSQPRGRPAKTSTPKDKEEKTINLKQKSIKSDKIEKDKQDATLKSHKRNSRTKSLSSSQVGKGDKNADKKNDKDIYTNTKDKVKDINISVKDKESVSEKPSEKANKTNNDGIDSVKPVKDHMQIDDNVSLAVLARETANKNISGLPTITSVRSLSTTAQSTSTITNTITITTTTPKTIETTIPTSSTSNVFTPLTTENVRNMKDAVEKLQKLRTETDKTLVGRVGVRSFARMTSPPAPPPESEKQNDTVEVEVKSEPIDFDDADRQVEKMDLMKAFQLRPVNPVTMANLRDVRINKVVVAPPAQKAVTKAAEVKIRARKTFPQPRKDGNESRSELNGKNSMVYIPIQPPTTQAPTQRPTRPITINGNVNTQTVRPQAPTITPNSVVNTQSTPLASLPVNTSLAVSTPKPTATFATNSHSSSISVPAAGQLPTIGHVPTTVHTVPLLTSVNGQWTFSLQPMMSVGGDGTGSPAVMNGLADRNQQFIPIAPANPLAMHSSQLLPNSNNNTCSNNSNCENTPVEMPRLQQRPPLVNPFDTSAPAGPVPVPSCAGPITAKLSQNAVKLADFFRNLLVDSLEVIDDPSAQAALLKVQLEQAKWKHQQEVNELKHTHELLTTEMRVAFEKEKARTVSELRRVAQAELEAAVKTAKTKQWCANCNQEAQFYCCWNTSYCDYSCQRSHWTQHFAVCTQQRNADNNANENGNLLDRRLQPGPENLPKSSTAPTLAVGTKITPTRVYAQAQEGHPQKTSIIVSMVEDPSGNPMVKCVGTYKSPGTQQVSPLLLNKQLMNDENAAKKVMTSGGYLIVGAGNNTPLTTTRRNLPVQFTYNT